MLPCQGKYLLIIRFFLEFFLVGNIREARQKYSSLVKLSTENYSRS